MRTVCISAGHQPGLDNGATYGGLREADLTVKIAARAAEALRNQGVGVLEVPHSLDLVQTIQWINARAKQIEACVEVHINAGGGTGIEVWDYAGTGNLSDRLAKQLLDAMVRETGLRSRGTKDELTNRHGRLGFVHDTIPVAALAECGFVDGDNAWLKQDANLTKMAMGLAKGMLSFVGIPWKDTAQPLTDKQKLERIAALCVGTGSIDKWKIRTVLQS